MIQGRHNFPSQYVKTIQVQVSDSTTSSRYDNLAESSNWATTASRYTHECSASGGSSGNSKVHVTFAAEMYGRYVKIFVLTWQGHISMRAGIFTTKSMKTQCKERCTSSSTNGAYKYYFLHQNNQVSSIVIHFCDGAPLRLRCVWTRCYPRQRGPRRAHHRRSRCVWT